MSRKCASTRRTAARAAALTVLVPVLVVSGMLLGATPSTAADDVVLCATADELVRSADPGAALALIDARQQELDALVGRDTGALCTDAAQAAAAAQAEADDLVARAKELMTSDPAEAAEKLAEAKALDAKDPELVRLTSTWSQGVGKAWTAFRTRTLEPLGPPLAVALAVALGWLVLGRVLVQLVYRPSHALERGAIVGALWGGALGALGSGLVVTLVLPGRTAWWWAVAGLLGALGALCFSYGLAARLRVTVDASETGGEVALAATRVVAELRELGAGQPRGLEVPVGTDVKVLTDSVTEVKGAGWVATLVSAVSAVLGFSPWRVVLHRAPSGTAVVVSRNGRTAGSAIVRADLLGPGQPKADVGALVASFVLLTLAEGYQGRRGFEELLGADDWRSLGLVASARIVEGSSVRGADDERRLLTAAVRRDGKSPFARIALNHHLYRDTSEPWQMEGYGRWLYSESLRSTYQGPWGSPMRVRLLVSAVVVTLNSLAARPGDAVAHRRLWLVRHDLKAIAEAGGVPGDMRGKVEQLLDAAASALAAVRLPGVRRPVPWDVDVERRIDGLCVEAFDGSAYNTVCRLVEDGEAGRALALYAVVADDPVLLERSTTDPSLRRLRERDEMWTAERARSATELLSVAPFKVHATALRDAGLTTARAIAATPPGELAGLAAMPIEQARRLVGIATVVDRDLPTELARWTAEVVRALVASDVRRRSDLCRKGRRKRVAAALKDVPGLRAGDLNAAALRRWLA